MDCSGLIADYVPFCYLLLVYLSSNPEVMGFSPTAGEKLAAGHAVSVQICKGFVTNGHTTHPASV